ncbi:Tryptophan 5-hydroxylase [Collichthys lucidus]|uniref:Tryptophan 5-hydroxylase n=1 Tax=Collichthys lucidus TaxID=240159 RepID=A0A4U5U942_COLLU|nr:Tryptophan 5-hydroxylase [Collichthys lucidus]
MYAQKSAEQGPHRGSSFDSVNSEAKPLNNEVTFSKIDGNQDNRSTSTGRTTIEKRVATIIFSLRNEVGGLVKVLKLFQKISDLDLCGKRVLMYGSDLDADHPYIEVILKSISRFLMFVSGDPIPRIDFTAEEVRTWGMVFRELNKLYPSHACKEYLKNLPLLSKHCNYSEDNIPQLDDVSHFLKVEFGLCKQDGRHALSDKARILPFDPPVTSNQKCMITTFQDAYFVSDSFEDAKNKMREFAKTIQRPFTVRYDPYTQSMDVLKDTNSINGMVKDIRHELDIVEDALNRVNA